MRDRLLAGAAPTGMGDAQMVFTELPRLRKRAGLGTAQGTINGIFRPKRSGPR